MEAVGIEPTSCTGPTVASTCIALRVGPTKGDSRHPPPTGLPASFLSSLKGIQTRTRRTFAPPISSDNESY